MFASQDRALSSPVVPPAADVSRVYRATADPATAPDECVAPVEESRARVVPSGGADGAPGPSDDSWRLMVLFVVFVAAPLVVVAAVWAMAAVGSLWALIFALGVYVVATLVVFATVAFVLSGDGPLSDRHGDAG
jgi:hypothetical protein